MPKQKRVGRVRFEKLASQLGIVQMRVWCSLDGSAMEKKVVGTHDDVTDLWNLVKADRVKAQYYAQIDGENATWRRPLHLDDRVSFQKKHGDKQTKLTN